MKGLSGARGAATAPLADPHASSVPDPGRAKTQPRADTKTRKPALTAGSRTPTAPQELHHRTRSATKVVPEQEQVDQETVRPVTPSAKKTNTKVQIEPQTDALAKDLVPADEDETALDQDLTPLTAEDDVTEDDTADDGVTEVAEEEEEEEVEAPGRPAPPQMPGRGAPGGRPQGMHGRPQVVPRTPSKAENFVEGDHVVYPTHGVGKVERIATEEISGHKLELIHITFEENRMKLRVPVSKARSAGLRKLATRKMFDEALAILKGRARVKRTMWSRRAQEYEAKINSGDPLAIAEVVRDLHRNAGQPDQSFSERQIYEAAMDRLAAELAALDKTDKGAAIAKLTNFLKVT